MLPSSRHEPRIDRIPSPRRLRRPEADAVAHDPVMERVEKLEKTVAALTGLPGEVLS